MREVLSKLTTGGGRSLSDSMARNRFWTCKMQIDGEVMGA